MTERKWEHSQWMKEILNSDSDDKSIHLDSDSHISEVDYELDSTEGIYLSHIHELYDESGHEITYGENNHNNTQINRQEITNISLSISSSHDVYSQFKNHVVFLSEDIGVKFIFQENFPDTPVTIEISIIKDVEDSS